MTKIILVAALLCFTGNLFGTIPGLTIGSKAPDFTLQSDNGSEVTLTSLIAHNKVALVFYRSADWCPFCRRQLQDLQKDLALFTAAGVQLVGISYDSPATLAAAAEKLGIAFPLLSDQGSKTIEAYQVLNTEAKGRGAGIAHPVIFIVDQAGLIRVKLLRDGYRERPESAEIIAAIKTIE